MSMSDVVSIDRRAELRRRSRQAIVDAAAALLEEHGGLRFTVDQLAERADVSRRTVFNHFGTLDDVVTEVCSQVLGGLVDTFVAHTRDLPGGDDSPQAVFAEVANALRTTDLVGPMAYLTRILGGPPGLRELESPWTATLLLRSFNEVSRRFSAAGADRHPGADELDVFLLVNMLMSGVVVLYMRWASETGAVDDDASRATWNAYLERLIDRVGAGYGVADAAARPAR